MSVTTRRRTLAEVAADDYRAMSARLEIAAAEKRAEQRKDTSDEYRAWARIARRAARSEELDREPEDVP